MAYGLSYLVKEELMDKKFRFGLQYFTPESPTEWRETARRAEDAGYSTFFLADHYIGPGRALEAANHPIQTVAAIPAMMAAADATSSIMIGCKVICVDYHHPTVLAKELATIDFLSEGRLEIGFGAGWVASEYEAMGMPMDKASVRIKRMGETVELCREFFRGSDLNYEGDYVYANEFAAVPASPQENGPKIMIGGGAKKILTTAGTLADIVSLNFNNSEGKIGSVGIGSSTADKTREKIGWIKDGAGSRFDQIELELPAYFTTITNEAASVREGMAANFGLSVEDLNEYPHAFIGSVAEICETLEKRREEYGISYISVNERHLEEFAPVVAALSGK
jgi:probable F420-dependent oxidoreductase